MSLIKAVMWHDRSYYFSVYLFTALTLFSCSQRHGKKGILGNTLKQSEVWCALAERGALKVYERSDGEQH